MSRILVLRYRGRVFYCSIIDASLWRGLQYVSSCRDSEEARQTKRRQVMPRQKTDVEIIAGAVLQNCMQLEPDMPVLGDLRAMDLVRMSFAVLKHCPLCDWVGLGNPDCQLCALAKNIRDIEQAVQEEEQQGHSSKYPEVIDLISRQGRYYTKK